MIGLSLLWLDMSRIWPEVSFVCLEIAIALKGLYIDAYACIHSCSHIYGLVTLIDIIQSSFARYYYLNGL